MLEREIEERIKEFIKVIMLEHNQLILSKRLTYEISIKRQFLNSEKYLSEVEINFYRDDNFVDVVEQIIYFDNELFSSESEIKHMLKEDILDVL